MKDFNLWLEEMQKGYLQYFENHGFSTLTFYQYCDLWLKRELGLNQVDSLSSSLSEIHYKIGNIEHNMKVQAKKDNAGYNQGEE